MGFGSRDANLSSLSERALIWYSPGASGNVLVRVVLRILSLVLVSHILWGIDAIAVETRHLFWPAAAVDT